MSNPLSSNDTEKQIVILKSQRYGDPSVPSVLPYRIDELGRHGYRLTWTDANTVGSWARVARWTERWAVPWTQAWLTRTARRRSAATVAIFESEGHGVALARRLTGRRRPPLIIIGCWLADLARDGGATRRRIYRWLYRAVDTVVVFSPNQRRTLADLLDIDPVRVAVVDFGVDLEELKGVSTSDDGSVVAAGRDLGRDWPTLLAAVRDTGSHVVLITRERQVAGLDLPPEVEFLATLDRAGYLARLAAAAVVVIPTKVREYPTGQTVLLEAMALGKACVVTDTPAMRHYVSDGVDAVLVAPGDPDALRRALQDLLADPVRREEIGAAARRRSDASGGAATMWREISEVIATVAAPGR